MKLLWDCQRAVKGEEMKYLLLIGLLFFVGCGSDPEFENCTVEIITSTDTLRLDNAFVEFEGSTRIGDGVTDNVMVIKGNGEWNFYEPNIIKMTIIYEPTQ